MSSSDEDWGGLHEHKPDAPSGGAVLTGASDEEDWTGMGHDEASAPMPLSGEEEQEDEEPSSQEHATEGQPVARQARKMTKEEVAAYARQRRLQLREERRLVVHGGPATQTAQSSAADADLREQGSLLARSLARCSHRNLKSFLKPAVAHAEEVGLAPAAYRDNLWSYGEALLRALKTNVTALVKTCVSGGAAAGEGDPHQVVQPVLFVRSRKYDETNMVLSVGWDHGEELLGPGQRLVDMEVGPTKVFVTEIRFGMVVAKGAVGDPGAKTLAISAPSPCILQAVEHNSAECYLEALRRVCC